MLLESNDQQRGHEFWMPGVYCSPRLHTARQYARPHVLFGDGIYHRAVLELHVDIGQRRKERRKGGEQWIFPSEAVVITAVLVEVNAPPLKGEERLDAWVAEMEASYRSEGQRHDDGPPRCRLERAVAPDCGATPGAPAAARDEPVRPRDSGATTEAPRDLGTASDAPGDLGTTTQAPRDSGPRDPGSMEAPRDSGTTTEAPRDSGATAEAVHAPRDEPPCTQDFGSAPDAPPAPRDDPACTPEESACRDRAAAVTPDPARPPRPRKRGSVGLYVREMRGAALKRQRP
mmetsp:Transcript_103120/g.292128  ORF Transcript_103120/g.292128 Transcript_103120/m.292128 type:complete len:288 (+) Transcript_103120:75-938(+)